MAARSVLPAGEDTYQSSATLGASTLPPASPPLPSLPPRPIILQHPPHLDSYTEEPTVRRILLGTTLPCATAHSIYHISCWCCIISSPDDDTLVLPLNQHVPEHVVCQSIDMRGVLVGGLGRGRGGEGRGGEGVSRVEKCRHAPTHTHTHTHTHMHTCTQSDVTASPTHRSLIHVNLFVSEVG